MNVKKVKEIKYSKQNNYMAIYFEWGVGWYYVTAFILAIWIGLMVYRKNYKLRAQITVGTITLVLSFVAENIAVSQGIWNYVPGNWPLILWFIYFLMGMTAYQIVKTVEKK